MDHLDNIVYLATNHLLTLTFLALMGLGVYLSFLSGFFQLRQLAKMVTLLTGKTQMQAATQPKEAATTQSSVSSSSDSISALQALWTAMSTTIGIGNIFGPIVAIAFGGPGAILAYFFASIFGSILTYSEVFLAMKYRRKGPLGKIEGGAMCYIERSMGSEASWLYAFFCAALLAAWSMSQSHTICHMLQTWNVSPPVMGAALALLVIVFLALGITWIAELNTKMVPLMFVLYVGSTSYIVGSHYERLPAVFLDIFKDFFCLDSVACGITTHSFFEMMRWGFARAIQSNEAGVGTAAIPHSQSEQARPLEQATLAMLSVYANGLICILSGLTLLVSDRVHEVVDAEIDVSIITRIFDDHFAIVGQPLFFIIAFLFGFGTILGNAYNGSRCFAFLAKERFAFFYTLVVGLGVFIGGFIDLKSAWSIIDYFIVPVIAINLIAILVMTRKNREELYAEKARSTPKGPQQR